MKNKKTKNIITAALVIASIMVMNPVRANAEWKQDNIGWWYTEGNSWATGWRLIDGNWYYFNKFGYMEKSTLIDGYYVDSDGKWKVNNNVEINKYIEMLSNSVALNQYNNIDSKYGVYNRIIDIDQDGIYEMIISCGFTGSCSTTVFKYENGNVHYDTIFEGHTGYLGYDSNKREILIGGWQTASDFGSSYKYENYKLIKVDDIYKSQISNKCTLNEQYISENDYNNFMNRFK